MHWGAPTGVGSVSASTRSVSITVNNATKPTVVANAPPSRAAAATTTITIDAPPGTDSFLIEAWDQPNGAGKLLAWVTVGRRIIAGQSNAITALLEGLCTKIVLAPSGSQPFVIPITQANKNVYELVGPQAEKFAVTPEDADGNAIVSPDNASSITLTSNVVKITPLGGNVFSFLPIAMAEPNAPGIVTATLHSCGCTGQALLAPTPALYVTNTTSDTIMVYDENGNRIVTTGPFLDLIEPYAIDFDSLNGHLYVLNSNGATRTNSIAVYDQNGNQVSTTGSFPNTEFSQDLAVDSSKGRLYISNYISNSDFITVYDQNGEQLPSPGSFADQGVSAGISFDPTTRRLYLEFDQPIRAYDENGNQITTAGSFPNSTGAVDTAFDLKGRVYAAIYNFSPPTLLVYDRNGNAITTSGSFANLHFPRWVAFDPSNSHLYVSGQGIIQVYDTDGNQVFTSGNFASGYASDLTFAAP